MDIGSISSMYLNNIKDSTSESLLNKVRILTDSSDASKPDSKRMSTGHLESPDAKVGGSDEELMEACKEFEAYFTEQVFKNMRKAMVPQGEDDTGSMSTLKNYFEDELWKNYSSAAADQSNNGLAQMLYEQMKRNQGVEIPKEPDESAVAAVSSEVVSEEE